MIDRLAEIRERNALIEEWEKKDLGARWQRHRELCLELAVKLGAASAERAIEMADKLSAYILQEPPNDRYKPRNAGDDARRYAGGKR